MRPRTLTVYRPDDPAGGGTPDTPDPAAVDPPAPEPQEPETVTLTKAEAEALRRQAREGREAQKQAEKERREADEKRAAEQGQWEEIARRNAQERDDALAKAAKIERDALVGRLALGRFHDPSDVLPRLTEEELADESSIRAGLDRVAREAPHLVRPATAPAPEIGQVLVPPGIKPADGTAPGQELTREAIEAMSPAEVIARGPEIDAFFRKQATT